MAKMRQLENGDQKINCKATTLKSEKMYFKKISMHLKSLLHKRSLQAKGQASVT